MFDRSQNGFAQYLLFRGIWPPEKKVKVQGKKTEKGGQKKRSKWHKQRGKASIFEL